MSFIDLYRELHADKIQQEFPPSSRVLIDTLIGEFNSARWIDSLVFSERDLVRLTGLKKTTLHEAKHFLTAREYLKCTPFRNKTRYSLGDKLKEWLNRPVGDQLPTSNRPVGDQLPTAFENPNIRVRENIKDVKTDLSTSATTRACAPVNYDIDRLVERWEQSEAFGKLDMLIVAKLQALLKTYTCDEILAAMDKAILGNESKHGVNYNYFEAILKGGDKNVRVGDKSRTARRNVLTFAGGRAAVNSGDIQTGKGRFDDDTPDYSWLRESDGDTSGTEN